MPTNKKLGQHLLRLSLHPWPDASLIYWHNMPKKQTGKVKVIVGHFDVYHLSQALHQMLSEHL